MARKIRLHSPLKPVPLALILKEAMHREWTPEEKKKGRVYGSGTENKIFLKIEHWGQRDDSSYSLAGTMNAERGGTLIDAKIGRIGKAKFFVYGWFGFLSIFIIVGLASLFIDGAPWPFSLMFLGVPIFMMALGGWIFSRSAKRGPEDEKRILKFLSDEVQAREIKTLG